MVTYFLFSEARNGRRWVRKGLARTNFGSNFIYFFAYLAILVHFGHFLGPSSIPFWAQFYSALLQGFAALKPEQVHPPILEGRCRIRIPKQQCKPVRKGLKKCRDCFAGFCGENYLRRAHPLPAANLEIFLGPLRSPDRRRGSPTRGFF